MRRPLHFEELEARIAPAIVSAGGSYSFLDSNGDHVTVFIDGPEGMQVTIRDLENMEMNDGDSIGYLLITGADATSTIRVSCDGAGGDDILISQLISAPGQDVGQIILGYDADGLTAGTVTLGAGADVVIGGDLRLFAVNGGMDLGSGHQTIVAGGDIGTIFMTGALHVDAVTGSAAITAGAGGGGNVDFLYVGGTIYDGSDTTSPDGGTAFTGTVVVYDDAGDGTAGSLTLKLAGAGASGYYWAVPVVGGGSVLARVAVTSENTALLVTGSGAGGDVTEIMFAGDGSSATIAGVADTDLLVASATNGFVSVVNKSAGGDIAAVFAESVGLIQTGKLGNFGSTCTGTGNATPVFDAGPEIGLFTSVAGTIGKIQVGGIYGAGISADTIGAIVAGPGGISSSMIMADTSIGSVAVSGIYNSQVVTPGTLGTVSVGSAGVYDSMLGGLAGIASISVKGTIGSSLISSADEDNFVGGAIGSITADSLVYSRVSAMQGIGSVVVKGAMGATDIVTLFDDGRTPVGGALASLAAGGIYGNSTIQSLGDIGTIKVGVGGISGQSSIDSRGAIGAVQVAGDWLSSSVTAGGAIHTIRIGGDLGDGAAVTAEGGSDDIAVKGSVVDAVIMLGTGASPMASAGPIAIGGMARGLEVAVFGSLAGFYVKGQAYAVEVSTLGDLSTVAVGKQAAASNFAAIGALGAFSARSVFDCEVTGGHGVGTVAVKGDMIGTTIEAAQYDLADGPIAASIGGISAGGTMLGCTVSATGDIGLVTVKGAMGNTTISAVAYNERGLGDMVGGGNIAGIKALGQGIGTDIEAYGGIGHVDYGVAGMAPGATMTTIDGDFAGLTTKGLVYGQIMVGGDLTGSVLSAGGDALRYGQSFHMTDANNTFTDGSVTVNGAVMPGVVVS